MDFLKDSKLNLESLFVVDLINVLISEMMISDKIKINLPTVDVEMQADRQKFNSLFSNLIINAIQSMGDEGTITIRILKTLDGIVEIELEDNGSSIPEENILKIFEPLFTTKQIGTGLGLASCKKIVEQHNGTISVKNNPVTFMMNFPSTFSE